VTGVLILAGILILLSVLTVIVWNKLLARSHPLSLLAALAFAMAMVAILTFSAYLLSEAFPLKG
jgi:formate/nitrite transporter FocA (FNT family)